MLKRGLKLLIINHIFNFQADDKQFVKLLNLIPAIFYQVWFYLKLRKQTEVLMSLLVPEIIQTKNPKL